MKFDGYRRVAAAGRQAGRRAAAARSPPAQALDLLALEPTQHFTQPPPRYTEATLIKALEKENIGRPSTYADIIQKIQARKYVEQKERRFHATNLGMVVTDLLVQHFPKIMDLKFTAHMEDELDDIATAKEDMVKVLDEFYHPFQDELKLAKTRMEKVQDPDVGDLPRVRGPRWRRSTARPAHFLGCSRYPECKATRPIDGQPRAAAVETEHRCSKCGKPLMLRESKRGPFLSCSGYPSCKESFNIDEQGNPVPSVVETEHVCEKCGKPMALRQGIAGQLPRLHGLPQVPEHDAGRRPGAARSGRSRSRSSARSAAARWGSSTAAAARSSAA